MKHGWLNWTIIAALVLGTLFGELVLYAGAEAIGPDHWTRVAGEYVLIRPLKMLIIPLILFSVVSGVCSIGDPSRLGLVGGATVFYYLATMAIAVTIKRKPNTKGQVRPPGSKPPTKATKTRWVGRGKTFWIN